MKPHPPDDDENKNLDDTGGDVENYNGRNVENFRKPGCGQTPKDAPTIPSKHYR